MKIAEVFICTNDLISVFNTESRECPKELDISNVKGIPNSFSYKIQHRKKDSMENPNKETAYGVGIKGMESFKLQGLQEEGKNNFLAKLDWKIRINPTFLLKGIPFISKKEIERNFEMAGIKFKSTDIGCAYPVGNYNLTIDVACNHYADYYLGNAAPTDTHIPIPTVFWVIKDATFRFRCDLGKDALTEALEQYGLGKQGSTYGHFTLL